MSFENPAKQVVSPQALLLFAIMAGLQCISTQQRWASYASDLTLHAANKNTRTTGTGQFSAGGFREFSPNRRALSQKGNKKRVKLHRAHRCRHFRDSMGSQGSLERRCTQRCSARRLAHQWECSTQLTHTNSFEGKGSEFHRRIP